MDGCGLDSRLHLFLNPYSYLVLRRQQSVVLVDDCFVLHFDGVSMVLLARAMGDRGVKRESFDDTSLAPRVFSACALESKSVALIGSAPGIALAASILLKDIYSGLSISYVSDGFYSQDDAAEVLRNAERCDVVICSLGTPRQEEFLAQLKARNWRGTGYTCGGFLDQLVEADGGTYYPVIFDKLNLRWLYRIGKEPRRLVPRYLIHYPIGVALFVLDRLGLFFRKADHLR